MYKHLVILALVVGGNCLPQGAPVSVCESMAPFHSGGIPAQTSPSLFNVQPAVAKLAEGTRMRVTIGSGTSPKFQGFMMQARNVVDGKPVGSFVPDVSEKESKLLQCSGEGDTVTHSNTASKGPIDFYWEPPKDFLGEVVFRATVAQDYNTFWVGLESQPVRIVKRSEITDQDFISTATQYTPSTTPPYYTPESAENVSVPDDPFYKGCFVTKSCFGAPEGCIKTKDCKAIVAVTVRGDRYEFELKAPKDAKYVAVGLSEDDKMGDDSVIECVREGNGAKMYMSRTIPRPNLGVERLLKPTMGLEMITFNVTDGMLYCKVRRDVKTTVVGQEYDLINDQYYLLVAAGTQLKGPAAGFHDIAYQVSAESRSLSDVTELTGASKLKLRLHGAFMLVAWVGTASVGILLARYYRQTWVGSRMCGKDQWFAWHRFFMILTWALTVVAFILIFVELKAWSTERNPHAILGLVTTIICFLQPIGAYFRPHPGTPKRPIFNWIHWLGGNVAHILAIVTIFYAVKLSKAELPDWMDWILVAFVAFHVVMHLILSLYSWLQILGCMSDRSAERRVTAFPMKDLGSAGRNSSHLDRNVDAPNSSVRKVLLALYLIVIILLVAAMVVVTVLAPFEETWSKIKKSVMQE